MNKEVMNAEWMSGSDATPRCLLLLLLLLH